MATCITRYGGIIENGMNLRDFPFDVDIVETCFSTFSTWQSYDGLAMGQKAKGKTYRIRQVQPGAGEGNYLTLVLLA